MNFIKHLMQKWLGVRHLDPNTAMKKKRISALYGKIYSTFWMVFLLSHSENSIVQILFFENSFFPNEQTYRHCKKKLTFVCFYLGWQNIFLVTSFFINSRFIFESTHLCHPFAWFTSNIFTKFSNMFIVWSSSHSWISSSSIQILFNI